MATEVLEPEVWRPRRDAHERRVDAWVAPYLERRSRGRPHPVEDFLFTYYSFSPAALRRWHPGFGHRVVGPDLGWLEEVRGIVVRRDGAEVDARLVDERREQLRLVRRLLESTAQRPLMLSCFGLHEWAMVYRQRPRELRHASYPLRLGAAGTDRVVESHRVTCSHFDAYRFFTPEALPRNTLRPTADTRAHHEQPGCLHATMDLYKWAYKLSPLTSAELVADCFELAREVRLVDMRAAPYDLAALGVHPIAIETAAGKSEYVGLQRAFAQRAEGLRDRLVAVCDLTS